MPPSKSLPSEPKEPRLPALTRSALPRAAPSDTAHATSSDTREGPSDTLFSRPFVLMLCAQFCFGLSYSTFFLLPKYLAREMHADARAIGAVAATALISGVVAVPFIGAAIDRGRRTPYITWGAIVSALSACAFASVHSIGLPLYALRAINGVAYAIVFNATLTLAADLAPAHRLSQAIGLCGAAGMTANAIAPATAEWVADHHGWSPVFWLAAAAALAASLCSLGIQEPPSAPQRERTSPLEGPLALESPLALEGPLALESPLALENTTLLETTPSAIALIFDPKRFGSFLASAATGAGFGVMFTFTQPFALSLGANQVSGFFIGYTACALSVRLLLGRLADRVGRSRIAGGALALYGLVLCATSLLQPSLLAALGAGLGLAHGLLYPAINALGAEGVPRARRGAVMSYFSGCFYGGYALCVLIAGSAAKSYGYPLIFIATGLTMWAALPFLPRKARGPSSAGFEQ